MKSIKYLTVFITLCLLPIFVFDIYDHYKHKQAYDAKKTIIEVLESGFKEQKSIELDNIGNINWEQICFISYELNGIDVSDGLDIPVRYLKIPRTAFSQVANEYYNEFKTSRYGLVFFSVEQKILVAISLKDAEKIPASECHNAKNLVLLNQVTPQGRLLNFSQKQSF